MPNVDDFFAEQDERMNLPDEDVGEYLSRLADQRSQWRETRIPVTNSSHSLNWNIADQVHNRDANRGLSQLPIVLESGSLRLDSSIVPSANVIMDATTDRRKRKMSEYELDECATKKHKHDAALILPEDSVSPCSTVSSLDEQHVRTHHEKAIAPKHDITSMEKSASESGFLDGKPDDVSVIVEQERTSGDRHEGSIHGPAGGIPTPQVLLPGKRMHGSALLAPPGTPSNLQPSGSLMKNVAASRLQYSGDAEMQTNSSDRVRAPNTGPQVTTLPDKPAKRARAIDSSNITTPPNSTSKPSASKPTIRKTAKAAPKAVPKKTARKTTKKLPLMTPAEYVRLLRTEFSEAEGGTKSKATQFLEGMVIYFYGADSVYASRLTRDRMRLICKYGGTLLEKYDPDRVTHIVTADASKYTLLRNIGLSSLDEIPSHVPIVKWNWIASGIINCQRARASSGPSKAEAAQISNKDHGPILVQMDYEHLHASFSDRIPPIQGSRRQIIDELMRQASEKVKDKNGRLPVTEPNQNSGDYSNISEFTREEIPHPHQGPSRLPSPPSSPISFSISSTNRGPSKNAPLNETRIHSTELKEEGPRSQGPLIELSSEAQGGRDSESDDETEDEVPRTRNMPKVAGKRGFICDMKGVNLSSPCPNQDVIDKLKELQALHRVKPTKADSWRVFSYSKAIAELQAYPTRIRSLEEAKTIRGVGEKTAQKIMEIVDTGNLRRLAYAQKEDIIVGKLFMGIYGVGSTTAHKWYMRGCRSLEDLKAGIAGVKLSPAQLIGLQYYSDINSRMPRDEARQIYELIKPIALSMDPKLTIEIMGSYRRSKADCGDIDILITRPTDDGRTHAGILRRLIKELHRRGILTEDLGTPDNYDDLELVYHGLCRKDSHSKRRRIDFLTVPYMNRGAALLYYTGDDHASTVLMKDVNNLIHVHMQFNRSMRYKARTMNYSLNQRGLYAGVVRDPSNSKEKLNAGTIIASETEAEIFQILGVPWQEPYERVRDSSKVYVDADYS